MKKSEYEDFKAEFTAMQPTPRRGVLDELKKAHVVLLIASGLSRREAAGYVQCAHTTIGRSAAGDPDFAAKLCQAEATAHVQMSPPSAAAQDPRYWRGPPGCWNAAAPRNMPSAIQIPSPPTK